MVGRIDWSCWEGWGDLLQRGHVWCGEAWGIELNRLGRLGELPKDAQQNVSSQFSLTHIHRQSEVSES